MRRYMQGTLDFACGVYAVINALSCTHGVDLAGARRIFQETLFVLAGDPALWRAFIMNETDHYSLVRYLVTTRCASGPWECRMEQPFGDELLPQDHDKETLGPLFLPEKEHPAGPRNRQSALEEMEQVWSALSRWLRNEARQGKPTGRAALLRFHRFLPPMEEPVISHWTAACQMEDGRLILHDASSEKHAITVINKSDCLPCTDRRIVIRIVPESVLLLERAAAEKHYGLFSL